MNYFQLSQRVVPKDRLATLIKSAFGVSPRRSRGSVTLLWGLSSVDCGRSDYFIFLCDGVAIFAVMRKVLILALAMQASGPTRISRRTLPCKALVTPTAQRVAEWKKKTE